MNCRYTNLIPALFSQFTGLWMLFHVESLNSLISFAIELISPDFLIAIKQKTRYKQPKRKTKEIDEIKENATNELRRRF